MSGGSFDHKNYVLTDIADAIDAYADNCAKGVEGEYGFKYEAKERTLDKLYKTAHRLRVLERQVHLIDYWMAGDIGEDTLHADWPAGAAEDPDDMDIE